MALRTQIRAFRTPDQLWAAIVAAAEIEGVNASEILRRAAASYEPVRDAIASIDASDDDEVIE